MQVNFCSPGNSCHRLWEESVFGRVYYLAVEFEEKLAELEGLRGNWQFGTKAASSTGHVENKRVKQVQQQDQN